MTNHQQTALDSLEDRPATQLSEEILKIHLFEYNSLKNEQTQRIGFRDNLLYAMFVAFGGVGSYVLSNDNNLNILLILPWLCFILGWTYVVNDEKISAIGRYLRLELSPKLSHLTDISAGTLLNWENSHRQDRYRTSRKITQLIVDLLSFIGTGSLAIGMFIVKMHCEFSLWTQIVIGIDVGLLVILAFLMWRYADL
jgi:hypothetical protein